MSKEQELPPLDGTIEETKLARMVPSMIAQPFAARLMCRERQLRDALAQIATLSAQVEEQTQAIEHDRTSLCSPIAAMRKALQSREWLRLGRGSYEWNDDRWRDEFAEACNEIYAAIEPLQKVASDWTHCSRDGKSVESARINWKARSEIAESELAALREGWEERYRRPYGERILDTTAHNARAEDGVVWTPDTTGGEG